MRLHRTVTPISRPKWRVASIIAGAAAVALGGGWVSGCSVLYELSTAQCSSNSDCDALGEAFIGLECRQNLCQEPVLTGCGSNAECIDDFGDGVRPWACINRGCVELLTNECPTILPQTRELWRTNLRTPNPLILAGTGQIEGTALDPFLMNYELALRELDEKGMTIGGRQVVMLGCKASPESTEELDAMMTHLADVVKVPGMVATFASENLQRAFTQKGDAANMFFMSAFDSDATLATLNDRGLIWHIGPGFDVVARAYAPLLTRALAHLQVSTGVKVATVVTSNYRLLNNMVPTITDTPANFGLIYNGKSVSENASDDNYLGMNIGADPTESIAPQVADLLEFLPTVIVSAAESQLVQRLIPAIEAGWPSAGPPRPFYILSPINYNDPALIELIGSDPGLISRMAGINAAAAEDDTAYNAYVNRWDIAFPDSRDVRGTENFYDAAYYLLYSAAAAGQNLTDGLSLVAGMNRLLSGSSVVEVGPADLPDAFAMLAVGSSTIRLDGTLGPPDFNRADGTRQSAGSVWCVDGSGFHADVLRYVPNDADPTAATLTGNFPCISGF